MKPEPLARQEVDHIDVGPLHQRGQSFAGRAADLGRFELGAAKHRVVDGRDPEPILQTGQRRLVPGLPEPAQPDDSHPEPHVLRPDQARLLAVRSSLAVTLSLAAASSRLSAYRILSYPNGVTYPALAKIDKAFLIAKPMRKASAVVSQVVLRSIDGPWRGAGKRTTRPKAYAGPSGERFRPPATFRQMLPKIGPH